MKPILQITSIRSNDESIMKYRVTITQGAEIITSEDILLENLHNTIPYRKGIVDVVKVCMNVWEFSTNK